MHLFDLGPASASASGDSGSSLVSGALRGVGSLFGGGNGSRRSTTSTTAGIRGLGAEDLAQAQPDPAAVRRMEALRRSDADVRSFAERADWHAAPVDPLPTPAAPAPAPAQGGDPSRN